MGLVVNRSVLASFHPTGTQGMITTEVWKPAWRITQKGKIAQRLAAQTLALASLSSNPWSATWADYLNSLHFPFLVCKMGIYCLSLSLSQKAVKINVHEMLRKAPGV